MDKNKENITGNDSDEIQAEITRLMGPSIKEASPTLNKFDEPSTPKRNATKRITMPKSEEPAKEELTSEPTNIESVETDMAVQDILHDEADTLLDKQDDNIQKYQIQPKIRNPILRFFKTWWANKKLRNISVALVLIGIIVVFSLPASRYVVLNAAGVRSEMSFTVVDKISGRPVKNITVEVDSMNAKTADDGSVKFSSLKLGPNEIKLSKRSFKEVTIPVTIGWGSNPFDDPIEVEPTGTSFTFNIHNWLDGLAIKDAEVTDGESSGVADEGGKAILTIEPTDEDVNITIKAKGYRDEQLIIPADSSTAPSAVKMVAGTKDIFISKRDGKFDLYTRDLDGKNEILILPATGSEQADIHTVDNNDQKNVALVSSRAGQRNQDGYIMSDVYLVDIKSKTAVKVDGTQSERIKLLDWAGDKLIFVKTIAGPSASVGNRQRVMAYDIKSKEQKELATADYFSDVRIINGQVYYVVASSGKGSQSVGLGKITPNGDGRKNLLAGNVWSVYRTDSDNLIINASEDKWYNLNINDDKVQQLNGPPAQPMDNKLAFNQDGSKIAKIEDRDGKKTILVKSKDSEKDQEIIKKSGLSYPLKWVNDNALIYSVNNSDETARYIISLNKTDNPIKIGDVSINPNDQANYL